MRGAGQRAASSTSQSLWVRDRFLIEYLLEVEYENHVAIPLGQGQVFNDDEAHSDAIMEVAIPLGQGQVFNSARRASRGSGWSQSLWVRDRFLIWNDSGRDYLCRRNPFGSGTGF